MRFPATHACVFRDAARVVAVVFAGKILARHVGAPSFNDIVIKNFHVRGFFGVFCEGSFVPHLHNVCSGLDRKTQTL